MDSKWPSDSVDAALGANYKTNGVNAKDGREREGQPRGRLEFVNLMGQSQIIKYKLCSLWKDTKKKKKRKKKKKETGCGICLDFMIRHVRLQIKSGISGLMNHLVNYQRYLKTLSFDIQSCDGGPQSRQRG